MKSPVVQFFSGPPGFFRIMNPEVLLVGRLQIDVKQLLYISQKAYGRNIGEELDKYRIDIEQPSSLLTLYAKMKDQEVKHAGIQRNPGNLTDHLFYSFVILADEDIFFSLMEQTKLSTHLSRAKNGLTLGLVSGALTTWTDFIINSCSMNSNYSLRVIANKCLLVFDKEGFTKMFSEYTRAPVSDGTLILK